MRGRRIIIIGGNIAGVVAALNAREIDRKAEIHILSKETHPYCRPLLTHIIAGQTIRLKEIAIFLPQLYESKIWFHPNIEVLSLDTKDNVVIAKNMKTKKNLSFKYDGLVFATGGSADIPIINGVEKKGVFSFRTFKDAVNISKLAKPGKHAVVVGGGFIALEVAEALKRRGVKVTLLVRSRILRQLVEPNFSSQLKELIERKGVSVITGCYPVEIGGQKMVEYVKLNDDRKMPCSIVIFATGVKPNVDVPKKAGIELGNTGAIKVDTHMQTSMPGIYAAGDCAEKLDALTRKWFYFPVGSIAAKEAIIAGKNVAGKEIETKGIIRTQMDALFGINIISIGHTSESARNIGVMAKTVELTSIQRRLRSLNTHALAMAIIDDKDRVIGMQIMASRFTSWYSFELLKAIEMGLTLNRFLDKWPPITNLSKAGLWRVRMLLN